MTGFNSIYNSAILITGPDTDQKIKTFVESRIPNVIAAGDGETDLLDANKHSIYRAVIEEALLQDCFQSPLSRTLVVIEAHGTIYEGEHVIQATKSGIVIPTKGLFEYLASTIKTPFDVLMTACHGRGAQELVHLLPVGTKVSFFSSHDATTVNGDLFEAISTFPENKTFSVQNFYEHFLYGMVCAAKPALVISAENMVNLEPAEFLQRNLLAKTLPNDLKEKIGNKIANFCAEDLQCSNQLHSKLDSLSQLGSLESIINFPKTLEGKFDWYFNRLKELATLGMNDDNQDECLQYSANLDSALSSRFIEEGIPLKSTLYKYCDEDEEDDDGMSIEEFEVYLGVFKEILASNNDYCAIRLLGRPEIGILEPNGRFEGEQSEYGQYLLVSTFIQEYCSQNSCPEFE